MATALRALSSCSHRARTCPDSCVSGSGISLNVSGPAVSPTAGAQDASPAGGRAWSPAGIVARIPHGIPCPYRSCPAAPAFAAGGGHRDRALLSGRAFVAWRLARRRAPCRPCWMPCARCPFVLPPTVLGYYLILVVGRNGLLGPALRDLGLQLIFSWQGAVVAATVVVFPLLYKSARAALEQVDPHLENAARTLGASELRILLTVSLPLAWKGIFAGLMLAFARGMGEFGATLMVAGNIPRQDADPGPYLRCLPGGQ